jgi:DNA-binding transcriptional MerR regulator
MSLTNNWYTIDEATSKFGITTRLLQIWVDNGLVRTEGGKGKLFLFNGNDIEQEMNFVPSV